MTGPSPADPPWPSWRRPGFVIATNPRTTDLDKVCALLAATYWAADVPRAELERSFEASWLYNLLEEPGGAQIGFARVVTDRARFAWLSDVIVQPDRQGQGLGSWLVGTIVADPRLAGIRRWLLSTQDAHGLYRRFGWEDLGPGSFMVRHADPADGRR
jgi:GNAT superfamily N-acetyltransferase